MSDAAKAKMHEIMSGLWLRCREESFQTAAQFIVKAPLPEQEAFTRQEVADLLQEYAEVLREVAVTDPSQLVDVTGGQEPGGQ